MRNFFLFFVSLAFFFSIAIAALAIAVGMYGFAVFNLIIAGINLLSVFNLLAAE